MASPADEIIVRLTADASGLSAGLDEAAAQVTAATQEMTNSARSFADVMDELAAQETTLNAQLDAGEISAQAYADAMASLDAATEELGHQMDAAAAEMEALTAAQNAQTARWLEADAAIAGNTAELQANTAAQAENAAASSGSGGFRFRGLYGTISEVGNAFMSAEGLIAAAMAAIGVDALYAQSRIDNLTDAVAATGNASGVSAAEIDQWGAHIGEAVSTADDGQAIFQRLAGSGQLAGTALHAAGDAAVRLAQATGESDSAAASQVLRMDASASAVAKANEQFHFLTAAQLDEVNALFASGNAAEGAAVAFSALDAHLKKNAEQVKQSTSLLQDLKNAFEEVGRAADRPAGGYSIQGQIAHQEANLRREGPGSLLHYYAPETEKKIRELEAQLNAPVNDAWQAMQSGLPSPTSPAALANDTRLIRDHIAAHNLTGSAATDYQRSEWEKVLATAPKGSDAYATVWEKLQALDAHSAHASSHAAALAYSPKASPMTSWVPQSITNEMMRIQQKQVDEALSVTKTTEQSQAAHHVAMLETQRQHVQAMASIGAISSTDAIAREQSLADAIYKIKSDELKKEMHLAAGQPTEQARINAEMLRAADSHAAAMQSLADKSAAVQVKASESVVQPTLSAFSQITTGFVEGTLTRQQAELRLGDAIVAETINAGVQALAHHLAIEDAKTLATAEGTAERLALHVWAEAEAAAVHALHAVEWIVTEAAKAAASAFTALAGIPVVGPALAVAASVAAGAEVLSLVGKVASAEGGWDRVPYDGAAAILHKDEMVLPAELAEGVRNMAGGAGGGETHVHIHAMDSQSFGDFLRRNPAALLNALGHAHRTGHGA